MFALLRLCLFFIIFQLHAGDIESSGYRTFVVEEKHKQQNLFEYEEAVRLPAIQNENVVKTGNHFTIRFRPLKLFFLPHLITQSSLTSGIDLVKEILPFTKNIVVRIYFNPSFHLIYPRAPPKLFV